MPETSTWHIPYPIDSDPADVPADLEEMATAIDTALNGAAALGIPVGAPIPWLVSGIPAGFREFDGSAIVAATHPQLYAIFGGAMPDLRGKFLFGQGGAPGYAVGAQGGTTGHTLSPEQMPVHAHTVATHRHVVDSHAHGGGNHQHQSYLSYDYVSRVEHATGTVHRVTGLQADWSRLVDHEGPTSQSGAVISAEAPGTSWEAPGTTPAGGLSGVTQPVSHMNPFRAVRWITRAA